MLIYHPAFDSYHAIFRSLALLEELPIAPYEIERIRILDFYLLFPVALQDVVFPRKAVQYRRKLLRDRNRYEWVEDPQLIFARLEPYQMAAFRFLAPQPTLLTESISPRAKSSELDSHCRMPSRKIYRNSKLRIPT